MHTMNGDNFANSFPKNPLLSRNSSSSNVIQYSDEFSPDEDWLNEHAAKEHEERIRRPSVNRAWQKNSTSGGPSVSLEKREADVASLGEVMDLEEVPRGITRQARQLNEYIFPKHRFRNHLVDEGKIPLVLVACGSFSPITYLHLRMFEMATDTIQEQTNMELVAGYFSPVNDHYKKEGLAPAYHRVRMCELACERTSSWLMVDAWESLQPSYTCTARVLDHFDEEINQKRGGITLSDGTKRPCKIMLLAGGDLIASMGEPGVWSDKDLHHILGKFGCCIVERTGSDVWAFLLAHDIMFAYRGNILVIKQLIYNDISSTKVRLFIRRGMSIRYLLPNSVIQYIERYALYRDAEPVKTIFYQSPFVRMEP
ncbi:nicotinamide mononucleotide (NMN) adenylyltransferase [Schizosaccharomyces pombe]|uniref:Nicotinamide/nicotinic acid mononucleotide adenylyltransferase n=1 Tax=Schizosaccharomyces pombe (strain 972 / ATCC 24843) TaxID=284812 RepID=NMAH_SCHPO|nr:putative nicotinamide mononucleotide adenylyltransferase [Schizosaccharomyces pombe]Q9UT53.2 RecName: Full=Nicotinamide/nicotinic acid mononucleotide adenylyltransferase; Short=NMN/NaMN adenylyltransferase; AltName: Full=Nicotinamide-nucleotide adenylyltransferase; Short=NMN adenylyltransferase; Short=NMNAT; AltName: Full=Nicotinate-nucleotide adenylyltransferase; Short=NaMN adenylyltransferase; Short=NaMNAT [Schizosaccharomyces pombe 972h-]CAB55285.2 nicotinamide mononucleotide (NMN) adenylyl|eukprot:NP_592856.2 putative nicotinamide mononucleotide adenylyltransferase [Schizosaccharomyces pombe]